MKTDRFPYETSRWGGNQPEQAKRWFEELEMIGPQNVRVRLAQTDAGSAGAIAIGSITYLTIGFAQEWLAWHDRKREALETPAQSGGLLDTLCGVGGDRCRGRRRDRLRVGDLAQIDPGNFEQINAAIIASD